MQQTKQNRNPGTPRCVSGFSFVVQGKRSTKKPAMHLRTQKRAILVVDFCISLGENGTVIQTPIREKSSWKFCFREDQDAQEDQNVF